MIKKITAFVTENKTNLGRKALVVAGTVIGGLIIDMALRKPETHIETIIIEDSHEETPETNE
jgi:hypothetical protein